MSGEIMNRRLFAYIALFTLFACCVFVSYNPNIATNYTGEFSDGEVFTPEDSHFNFKDFELNCTGASNFTARTVISGHTQLIDGSGDRVINYLELDKMIPSNRDKTSSFLKSELEKPSWTVDGVCVHEITFVFYDNVYSAYIKDSSSNAIIYLSSTDEHETAEMMNSLEFKED